MRPPHVIKGNKNTELPREVIFFDCETTETKIDDETVQHNLKLGVACHLKWHPDEHKQSGDWHTFTNEIDFWAWAVSKVTTKRRMVFIAHNLDFDFLVLNGITELTAHDYHLQTMISSGQLDIWSFVQYKYKPGGKRWANYEARYGKRPRVIKTLLFLDLMNYFDTTLKAVGESVGVLKGVIDFATCTKMELQVYCQNDVLIMVAAWKKWLTFIYDHDLGVWGKTLPSQAFNAYRHRFMPHKIFVHTNEKATALEREGYFGGRCECFQLGYFDRGPFYLLDINSMYPYVMRNNRYPVKLLTYLTQGEVKDILDCPPERGVMAKVLVHTMTPRFPMRFNQHLVFPVGSFWTALCGRELKAAVELEQVIAVKEIAVYETKLIFQDYIDFFWATRVGYKHAGDKPFTYMTKILMNSLYGKFGQRIDDYTYIGEAEDHSPGFYGEWDVETQKWLRFRKMNGKVDLATGKVEGYHSFVAISAFVTSYARSLLYTLLSYVPAPHLFYCDTDSLIVDKIGLKLLSSLIDETELGALHLEKESETITIFNAKDYIFGGDRKIKGVRTTAKRIDEHTFGQWQQRSLKRVLWNAQPDNCQWKWVEKTLQETYKKGTVDDDGVVHPFIFKTQFIA